jgi:hypothetical protein
MPKRTDKDELRILRVSVARLAQALDIDIPQKRVLDKEYAELWAMADEARGWNALIAACIDAIEDVNVRSGKP